MKLQVTVKWYNSWWTAKQVFGHIFTKYEQRWRVSLPHRQKWKQKAASRLSINSWCWKTQIMSLSTRCCWDAGTRQPSYPRCDWRTSFCYRHEKKKKNCLKIFSHYSQTSSLLIFSATEWAWCPTVNYSRGDKKTVIQPLDSCALDKDFIHRRRQWVVPILLSLDLVGIAETESPRPAPRFVSHEWMAAHRQTWAKCEENKPTVSLTDSHPFLPSFSRSTG